MPRLSLLVAALTHHRVANSMTARHVMMTTMMMSTRTTTNNNNLQPAAVVHTNELTLTCADGLKLAAQEWKLAKDTTTTTTTNNSGDRKILLLHGWMDNCASFQRLAPALLERLDFCTSSTTQQHHEKDNHHPDPHHHHDQSTTTTLVALDFPGHGWSDHRSVDGPPVVLAETVFYVAEAIRNLQWDRFTIIGHSMGAAVACIYTAAFAEHVEQLVLLEGVGPQARHTKDAIQHVRQHIQRRQVALMQAKKPVRVYPNLATAIETRCLTATKFPGKQYLSAEAARELVLRGSIQHDTNDNNDDDDIHGTLSFRHDTRLQWPSIQYWTAEMNTAMYTTLQQQTPTCLLLAEDGWPRNDDDMQAMLDLLKPQVFEILPGSHHFHADPDSVETVVDHVAQFLQTAPRSNKSQETTDAKQQEKL
jgi:pimeloyl-ACP methyl ester carboxylesterase